MTKKQILIILFMGVFTAAMILTLAVYDRIDLRVSELVIATLVCALCSGIVGLAFCRSDAAADSTKGFKIALVFKSVLLGVITYWIVLIMATGVILSLGRR